MSDIRSSLSAAPSGSNHSGMLPDHLEYFARVHQRSVALVRHVLRNDPGTAAVLVSKVERTDTAQIVSLAQLCGLLLAQMPVEQRESLLNKAATTLAASTDCLRLLGDREPHDDHSRRVEPCGAPRSPSSPLSGPRSPPGCTPVSSTANSLWQEAYDMLKAFVAAV